MSTELVIEGVILEFEDSLPCHRAIVRKVGGQEVVLADIYDGTVHIMGLANLLGEASGKSVKFLAEARDFGGLKFYDLREKEQRETNRRYKYIQKLQDQGITKITEKSARSAIYEVAQEIEEKPPHWQSVRGWYRRFIDAGGKLRGLYPRDRYKGCREPKIDKRVLDIIAKESQRYFVPSQPSMASITRNVEDKIIEHNLDNPKDMLKIPTYLTIQKRVLNNSYQKKQKSRKGANAFEAELANAQSGIITDRILERVEIDHTQLDIHVLRDDSGTLLGRPFITAVIDHYSHMLLGFQLSFENPSFASVSIACMNAFLPKGDFLGKNQCDGSWPAHGMPEKIVTDNGNEFWGKNFIAVADELGPRFQYARIRKGRYKSRVERFFGFINSYVLDDLPGVVRASGKCGDEYDARQEARLTFTEFKKYLINWIVGVYHNLPIDEIEKTPNELWYESEGIFPVPVEDEMELMPILMATSQRDLSGGGINIFGLTYNTPVLKDVYRRDGPGEVTVKYNPFDIGSILVLDRKNNVYLEVACDKEAYARGLSLFEHKKIKSELRKAGKSKLESPDLQRARVQLARERDEYHARNARRKTQVTTSKAARVERIGVEELKLVVDNSKKIVLCQNAVFDEEELSLDGWSFE